MKFSLVAILPAVLWTVVTIYSGDTPAGKDGQGALALVMFALWFLTSCVVGLYWAVRIVRFALRAPRAYKPAPWDPPLR